MYSIQNFKKYADLQEEYNLLKKQNEEQHLSKAVPFMIEEIDALITAFRDYFISKELQIIEYDNKSFSASYKNSTIGIAKIDDLEDLGIIIKLNLEEIDFIKPYLSLVQYSSPREVVKEDDLEVMIIQLQKDIQQEKGLSRSYENMRIKFYNKKNEHFNSKEDVINRLFGN